MKKVIQKILEFKCYKCSGTGLIEKTFKSVKQNEIPFIHSKCPTCDGTGIYKETFYYFIDGKKKIAFSGDTLK